MAMCEQVSYAARIRDDLRELLNKNGKNFFWDSQLSQIFKQIREKIAKSCMDGIQNFDPKRLTTLESDWLTTGMGFWLRQKYCQCKDLSLDCCSDGWRVSMVRSAFCSGTKSWYVTIEGKLAVIVWALQKTRILIGNFLTYGSSWKARH